MTLYRLTLIGLLAGMVGVANLAQAQVSLPQTKPNSPLSLGARTTTEVHNISKLIDALRDYAAIYKGKYPETLKGLVDKNFLKSEEFKKLTTSPLADVKDIPDGYIYFPGRTIESPMTDVLFMGKNALTDGKKAVGLQDGSVVWWKRAQIEAFLKTQKK